MSNFSAEKVQLAKATATFLRECSKEDPVNAEGLEVAIQCIAESFGFEDADADAATGEDASLLSIFHVYLQQKARKTATTTTTTTTSSVTEGECKAKAEELKGRGNAKLGAKQYEDAISLYTEAIALDPQNAIYYSNRAAAYSAMGKHDVAVMDCDQALSVNPSYGKAYSRKGLALLSSGDAGGAVIAYEEALRLDPGNQNLQASLRTAQQQSSAVAAAGSGSKEEEDPMSQIRAMAEGLSGGGGGEKANPMSGFDPSMLSGLMSNPAIAQMASQFMGGAGASAGAGGGGLADIMKNPEAMKMAQQMMGDPEAMKNAMAMLGGLGKK